MIISDPSERPTTIEIHDVEVGDILLHRRRKNLSSGVISTVTGSPYTHVSICVGAGQIAEAMPAKGIQKIGISEAMKKDECIAVFRSQMGFPNDRRNILAEFVDELIQLKVGYDYKGLVGFLKEKKDIGDEIFRYIEFYNSNPAENEEIKSRYFCSSFIAMCFCRVGIFHDSYPIKKVVSLFSPSGLFEMTGNDFGHILGYLLPEGAEIPSGDPYYDRPSFKALFG